VLDINDSITPSIKRNHVGPDRSTFRVAKPKAFSSFMISFRMLWVVIICISVWLTATSAHAQQFSIDDFAPVATTTATGLWCPKQTGSTSVAPHLELSMAKLTRFEVAEPLRPSTIEPNNHTMANNGGFELGVGPQGGKSISLAEDELLPPRSFLSIPTVKYSTWESSLADTRSLTNANGLLVYPLLQIDYAQSHLPISLYIPPLCGSDAR
jgi:hypothetical protein